jgi:hypothetical protein
MEALKKRNLTSHTYNENVLNETMVFLTTLFQMVFNGHRQ